jgi:hypothetical protein
MTEREMSKRRRHPTVKQIELHQIEWLKQRTGYPSPDEREKIILLRQELSIELIKLMLLGGKPDSAEVQALARKYGAEEVERATRKFSETMELPALIADEAKGYREYRQRYARFGAGLKFYTQREMDELFESHKSTFKESNGKTMFGEVDKLLLFGWRDWEDITHPAVPLRPDDFDVSQPATYPAPINELLEWGDDLHRSHNFADEADFFRWKKHIPALTRMALNKGLLNGWPTEKASWAPWHAIHALGELQAWESAPALASLADLENDWLSDHLPHIWADMGAEVEPSLWMILENSSASEKQRGLAAQSLHMMAAENDAMENKVIKGFEKLLKNTKTFNPTVNAYLIHFLNEMEAIEDVWEVIESAFEEDRVNTNIITPEDLEKDDFDDEFDNEEEEFDD